MSIESHDVRHRRTQGEQGCTSRDVPSLSIRQPPDRPVAPRKPARKDELVEGCTRIQLGTSRLRTVMRTAAHLRQQDSIVPSAG